MSRTLLVNISFLTLLLSLLSTCFANDNKFPLTRDELRKKFGQENTTFGDGKSCYRPCNGTKMTCYYEFQVENYETMSGYCGECKDGKINDCFKPGCIPANGVQRNIMTVNRQLPGTPINCCKDDEIIVDVTNHMNGYELSIHWHGIHQTKTPWMDGVPMVTQCPIFSGNTFCYVFTASEPGTHYYHSHTGLHRTNGIFGHLIVREHNDPNADFYDFDLKDHTISLSDWTNHMAEETAPETSDRENQPHSLLINGFGCHYNKLNKNFTYAPMAAFYMQKGKKHRIRIDNAASQVCLFEFCVEGHKLTVIATDGYSVKPLTVDCIVTSAGERYDVVLHAKNDTKSDEVLISVRGLGSCKDIKLIEFARIILVDELTANKTLYKDYEPMKNRPSYDSIDDPNKITMNHPFTNCADPNEKSYCVSALEQKHIKGVIGEDLRNENPVEVMPFKFYFIYNDDNGAMISLINNISNIHTPIPGLIQDDSKVKYCSTGDLPPECKDKRFCDCRHLVQLELCKVYEFILFDQGPHHGNINHPVHLHGYGFQVVDMGSRRGLLNGQIAFKNTIKLPVIKDTVMVPSGGFVRLRFRSCNPGYWLFHCHFEFHMHTGMAAIIKVGNRSDMVAPPNGFPTCGNYLSTNV